MDTLLPSDVRIDTHSHTLASGHAYSTMKEMITEAKDFVDLLCITDHGPKAMGAPDPFYFSNMCILPREFEDLHVIYGIEANILDMDGRTDYEELVGDMEYCIASWHNYLLKPSTKKENTDVYLKLMDKSYVNTLGHIDDGNIPIDYETVIKRAAEKRILIELNNSSLSRTSFRKDSHKNAVKMLELCKKYECPIVLGSDAHVDIQVGRFANCFKIIEQTNFPKSLVVHTKDSFYDFLIQRKTK